MNNQFGFLCWKINIFTAYIAISVSAACAEAVSKSNDTSKVACVFIVSRATTVRYLSGTDLKSKYNYIPDIKNSDAWTEWQSQTSIGVGPPPSADVEGRGAGLSQPEALLDKFVDKCCAFNLD